MNTSSNNKSNLPQEEALGLARLGFYVFPCNSNKKPILPSAHPEGDPLHGKCKGECGLDGHGLYDATTNTEKITEWWTKYPNALIGINCGKSNIFFIDVDKHDDGKDGYITLAELEEKYNNSKQLLDLCGPAQTTLHEGLHMGWKQPTDKRVNNGKLGDGLDLRGDGGYICTGGNYKILDGHGFDTPLTDAPKWVLDIINPPKTTPPEGTEIIGSDSKQDKCNNDNVIPVNLTRYVLTGKAAKHSKKNWLEKAKIEAIPTNRNQACYDMCKQLYYDGVELSEAKETAIKLLDYLQEKGIKDDHTEKEFIDSCESAYNKPWRLPAGVRSREEYFDYIKFAKIRNAKKDKTHPNVGDDMEITLTDTGNAERFARMYKGKIGYCEDIKQNWLIWNGKYWESGSEAKVTEKAGAVVQELVREASKKDPTIEKEKEEMNELLGGAKKLQSAMGIRNMLWVARGKLLIEYKNLNQDKRIVNFNNGTLNIDTLELTPHNPEQFLTRMIRYNYNPYAKCPRWMEFADYFSWGDKDTVKWIQKALGSTLSGRGDRRLVPFLHGNGHNGKSTFKEILLDIFGDYGYVIDIGVFLKRKFKKDAEAPSAYKRNLAGKRLVFTTEMPDGETLSTEAVKDSAGADTTTARGQHELEPYKFPTSWMIWMYGNPKPTVEDNSDAIWDRLQLIPFTHEIPPEKQIPMDDIKPLFLEEAEGIIAWMVEGYQLLLAEGIEPSKTIAQASNEYREEEDALQQFINAEMEVAPDKRIHKSEFYKSYVWYLKQTNQTGISISPTKVTQDLAKKGYLLGGHGAKYYLGLDVVKQELGLG